jgi:hypothetical protein
MNNVDIQNIIKSLEWINLEVIFINSRIENIKKALADLMVLANDYYEEDYIDTSYNFPSVELKTVDDFSFGNNNGGDEATTEVDGNGNGFSMNLFRDSEGRPSMEVRYKYESGKGVVAGEVKNYIYPDKTPELTGDKTSDFIISTLQGEE